MVKYSSSFLFLLIEIPSTFYQLVASADSAGALDVIDDLRHVLVRFLLT